jgi:hypothetical protein
MNPYFILDHQHEVIACDFWTWALWFEDIENRKVAHTQVGDVLVSTVCLGLDYTSESERIGPPKVFETMVFVNGDEDGCWRCATWQEAEAQHERVVAELKEKR